MAPPAAPSQLAPADRLSWPLRLGVAAFCAGAGYKALHYQPAAFSLLFTGLDLDGDVAQGFVTAAAWALLACVPLSLVPRLTPVCLLASAWVLLDVAARWFEATTFHKVAPLAAALRYLAPVALLLAWRGRTTAAAWCVRLAAVATFAGHGVEALGRHPVFVDYLLAAADRVGVEVSEQAAVDTLIAIGIADLVVAAVVLFHPLRAALLYMVFWGAVTALARVVHSGTGGLSDCVLRTIHATGPLAVLLHLRYGHGHVSADSPMSGSPLPENPARPWNR